MYKIFTVLIAMFVACNVYAGTPLESTAVKQSLKSMLSTTGEWKRILVSPGSEAQVRSDLGVMSSDSPTFTGTVTAPAATIAGVAAPYIAQTNGTGTGITLLGTSTFPSGVWGNTGNVGIGTTTPVTALHVIGSATVSGNLDSGTITMNGNIKLNGKYLSGDGENEGLYVSSGNGNVGIKTSSPSLAGYSGGVLTLHTPSTQNAVEFYASSNSLSATQAVGDLLFEAGTPFNKIFIVTCEVMGTNENSGRLRYHARNEGVYNFDALVVHETGNIKISPNGTGDSPTDNGAQLQVTGSATVSGKLGIGTTNPDKAVEVNLGTSNALRLTYDDADGSAASYADLQVNSGGVLLLNPSGGDVVIGTTTTGAQADLSIPTDNPSDHSYLQLGVMGQWGGYPFIMRKSGACTIVIENSVNATAAPSIFFIKSRGGNVAAAPSTKTINAGDQLFSLQGLGYTNDLYTAVNIKGIADTGWGATGNDSPGKFVVDTASDGSGTMITRFTVDSGGNVGFNTASFGTGTGMLAIANGTVTGMAAISGQGQIFCESGELKAMDGSGNITPFSPHSELDDLVTNLADPLPHTYVSTNSYLGKKKIVNMAALIEEIEKLSGKTLVTYEDVPLRNWTADQDNFRVQRDLERLKIEADIDEINTQIAELDNQLSVAEEEKKEGLERNRKDLQKQKGEQNKTMPPEYVPNHPPKWMQDRGVTLNL